MRQSNWMALYEHRGTGAPSVRLQQTDPSLSSIASCFPSSMSGLLTARSSITYLLNFSKAIPSTMWEVNGEQLKRIQCQLVCKVRWPSNAPPNEIIQRFVVLRPAISVWVNLCGCPATLDRHPASEHHESVTFRHSPVDFRCCCAIRHVFTCYPTSCPSSRAL